MGFGPILAVIVVLLAGPASARNLDDYQIGDRLDADIVTPIPLTIVDPEATEALKQKEAQRVPVVIRFHTSASDQVEAEFNRLFRQTRSNFLDSVAGAFKTRVLTADDLASFRFYSLATLFERQNRMFPLTTNRAALWASGDPDEEYRETLAATLREAMKRPIRPDTLPTEPRLGNTIRLVRLGKADDSLSADLAERQGSTMSRSNLVALAAARRSMQNLFLGDERAAGRFLAALIEPNCVVDADVTAELRRRRTEGMWAADNYKAGDVIARTGEMIDLKLKRALERIHERTTMGQLQQQVVQNQVRAAATEERMRWIIGVSVTTVVLFAGVVWFLIRRRPAAMMLPMPLYPQALNAPGEALPADIESWQQRALLAEQRVEKAKTAVRAGVLRQLAQWMSQKFVQKLASDRTGLLEMQKRAALEMAELEDRLNKIQAPLQDRLTAYERRIAELEKELAAKGEENRELIRTKIVLARKQLEIERERNRLEFN